MQKGIIGLIYEITGNPNFGSEKDISEDRISEFPKPHEVNEIARALKEVGYGVDVIDGPRGLLDKHASIRERCCLLFNKSIGFRGLERKIVVPAICQLYNLPLLGSSAYGMTLARHKYHTSRLLAGCGLRVPACYLAHEGHTPTSEEMGALTFPLIVKPNHESDSLGIDEGAICSDSNAVQKRVQFVHRKFKQAAIIEEFIPGEEWKVAVLGNSPNVRALGCVGVMKSGKTMAGSLQTRADVVQNTLSYYLPADDVRIREAMKCAEQIHELLGLRDYSRCDFRLDSSGAPWCMEVSTHPDICPECSFVGAALQRISSYQEVIAEIVRIALAREAESLRAD